MNTAPRNGASAVNAGVGDVEPAEPAPRTATVAELCRLAHVSSNSLYRYHRTSLQALRKHHPRGPKSAQAKSRNSAEQQRNENVALHEDIPKLAGLVDHYYTAFRESRMLLERRDRELADLRRELGSRSVPVSLASVAGVERGIRYTAFEDEWIEANKWGETSPPGMRTVPAPMSP
jgi:hypothetical protein